ncbi:hypothetical protein [Paraburkholderia sp. JHI869]|uniref:hypothetical protein n=1 Tax=Paraburkholderia sp. JHI869 TaxID=3112959 RepID=UPI00317487A0
MERIGELGGGFQSSSHRKTAGISEAMTARSLFVTKESAWCEAETAWQKPIAKALAK